MILKKKKEQINNLIMILNLIPFCNQISFFINESNYQNSSKSIDLFNYIKKYKILYFNITKLHKVWFLRQKID